MNNIKAVYTAFIISLALAGCSNTDDSPGSVLTSNETGSVLTVDENGSTVVNQEPLEQEIQQTAVGELTTAEADGLLYMREEEKLAHDVYVHMYTLWKLKLFDNIAKSEQSHTDAVKILLERYDLTDPAEGKAAGVFSNPDLQGLYDTLVAEGQASLVDGLMVGAAIEEIDIIDIATQVDLIEDNDDIVLVYDNLMKGSRNHLRAFVKNLQNQGIVYEPRYLSREEYDAIVNTEVEKGAG